MSDIAVAVEFSDSHIYDTEGEEGTMDSVAAAACRSWINFFPKVIIYTDSLPALIPGSQAERACAPHVQVATCCGVANATLNRSIATAQYKREALMLDFAQKFRGTRWRVSTEQDVWWHAGRLLVYLERIEQALYKDGTKGWQRWVVAGAGSGTRLHKKERPSTEMATLQVGGIYGPFFIFGEGLMDKVYSSASNLDEYRHAYLRHGCNASEGFWGVMDTNDSSRGPICPMQQRYECRLICTTRGIKYPGALYNNDHFMSFALLRAQHEVLVSRCKDAYLDRHSPRILDWVFGWCSGRLNGAVAQCEKNQQVCGLKRKRNAQKRAVLFVFNAKRAHPRTLPQVQNTLISYHHADTESMEWLADTIPQGPPLLEAAREKMALWDPTLPN